MDILLEFISTLGLILAVGSSTYALVFFNQSIRDGRIDEIEKRFLHTVYFVLRVGMLLLVTSVLWRLFELAFSGLPIFSDATTWFQFTLLILININALLMDRHLMPMWLGPGVAGGSWYSYFFSVVLASLQLPFFSLILFWFCLIVGLLLLIRVLSEYGNPRT